MAPTSLLDLVSALPATDGWGPPVSSETMLEGVPYAPYSKADKLGRMADWTEGKDRERGGRQQYSGRNYRGMRPSQFLNICAQLINTLKISKSTAQTHRTILLLYRLQKRKQLSQL